VNRFTGSRPNPKFRDGHHNLAGARKIEVATLRMTDAGRRALAETRAPLS
jgi:hypothetical protein